jgi:hypothetical protein
MLRSHHHLRGFIKLVLWDVYCVNGCGSFRLGYVGVGFGGNWLQVWYLLGWGVVCVGLVILASSPYSSEILVPGGGCSASGFCYVFVCVGPALLVFMEDGRYRPKHVILFCYKYHHLAIFIVVFWLQFTPPYSLNTQRGWHTSDYRYTLPKYVLPFYSNNGCTTAVQCYVTLTFPVLFFFIAVMLNGWKKGQILITFLSFY